MAENEITGNISVQDKTRELMPQGNENNFLKDGVLPFKDELEKMIQSVDISLIPGVNPNVIFDSSLISDASQIPIQIDTKKIEDNDAMFYLNLSNRGEMLNLTFNNNGNLIDASNYKTMEVSKTLTNILVKSAENNQSVRLDFDNEVTVILRVAKDGRLDASFIPNNKEVENYLKSNIDYLKIRFDEQNIAYSNISYKPYKGRGQKQQGDKK